jgi:hypothetical protein
MRRWAVLVMLAGCSSWVTVPPASVSHEQAFVVTSDTAYGLGDASYDGHNVVGTVDRAWRITACHSAAQDPLDFVKACGWAPSQQYLGDVISIEPTTIQDTRAHRTNKGETAVAVILIIAGVGALAFLGLGAMLAGAH